MNILLKNFCLQKENPENVKIEVNRLFAEIKELEEYVHENEELGISIRFKMFFTMVDSGLVIKYFDIAPMKCRICIKTMKQYRKEQHQNMVVSYVHPGSLDFGPSICHTKLHIGELILDWGARKDFKTHGARGFSELKKLGEKEMHDELLKLLGIHVNEPRAGGAGTSNTGEYVLFNICYFLALTRPYSVNYVL